MQIPMQEKIAELESRITKLEKAQTRPRSAFTEREIKAVIFDKGGAPRAATEAETKGLVVDLFDKFDETMKKVFG